MFASAGLLRILVVAVLTLSCVASSSFAADIAIIGGPPSDSFWSVVKKGVDDARPVVEANGGSVNYLQLQTYDNMGPDAAALIRTATAQGVDGIAITNWVPEAQDEAIKAAIAAGIKVIIYNSGSLEKAQELGALHYIGTNEYAAGTAAGEYFGNKGHKNVICVNPLPGAINQEMRCDGVRDGIHKAGGAAKQLPLPSSSFGDPTAYAEAIKATLLQDETIDGVIVLGAGNADAGAIGIEQAGKVGVVRLAAVDFNDSGLARIKEGTQLFAVDQQAYFQSFLAVTLLAAHIDFGTQLPLQWVTTGPLIIDASNVEATIEGTAKGAR